MWRDILLLDYIYIIYYTLTFHQALVAQWIERLFPKQKVVGSTPTWRVFCAFSFLKKDGVLELENKDSLKLQLVVFY